LGVGCLIIKQFGFHYLMSMKEEPDEVLIEKSRDGDMAAFKMLVVRHEGKVAGVVRSMLGATPEAEDVGQEVFIKFYDSLNKFRGESQVSTYLIRIAINLALNELKRKQKANARYASLESVGGMGDAADTMDLKELLAYEFKQLDADFQAVATLRLIEGYSTEETSSLLGIPLGTTLSRLARAQQKLRLALTKKL
jgi:RNA polymerase sigma-70 factor (ECF subfamily)